jgi:hypothetical protein
LVFVCLLFCHSDISWCVCIHMCREHNDFCSSVLSPRFLDLFLVAGPVSLSLTHTHTQHTHTHTQVPLLSKLTKQDRADLLTQMVPVPFAAGQAVITEGENGNLFYIIQTGTASVTRIDPATGEAAEIDQLEAGDSFGEAALLKDVRRGATVTATTPLTVLTLARDQVCFFSFFLSFFFSLQTDIFVVVVVVVVVAVGLFLIFNASSVFMCVCVCVCVCSVFEIGGHTSFGSEIRQTSCYQRQCGWYQLGW